MALAAISRAIIAAKTSLITAKTLVAIATSAHHLAARLDTMAVRINWHNLPNLLLPFLIALMVYQFLRVEFGFSRLSSMPPSLFVARQIQKRFFE